MQWKGVDLMMDLLLYQRTLIVIPIVHTEVDMGSLGESVRISSEKSRGAEYWTKHIQTVDDIWNAIRKWIFSLSLTYSKLRLYQDGLPICGHEHQIVKDVADMGSKNHSLLIELMDKGASLIGTENAVHLLEEYQYQQKEAGKSDLTELEMAHHEADQGNRLLMQRDIFMANRINATLLTGETGLLFIGVAHNVEPYLAPDIFVRRMPGFPTKMSLRGRS
jgi:hypothetical protein